MPLGVKTSMNFSFIARVRASRSLGVPGSLNHTQKDLKMSQTHWSKTIGYPGVRNLTPWSVCNSTPCTMIPIDGLCLNQCANEQIKEEFVPNESVRASSVAVGYEIEKCLKWKRRQTSAYCRLVVDGRLFLFLLRPLGKTVHARSQHFTVLELKARQRFTIHNATNLLFAVRRLNTTITLKSCKDDVRLRGR